MAAGFFGAELEPIKEGAVFIDADRNDVVAQQARHRERPRPPVHQASQHFYWPFEGQSITAMT